MGVVLAASRLASAQAPAPAQEALPAAPSPAQITVDTAAATAPVAATGGTIHGTVKAGPVPLPGVAVTATNTLTGKKYATTTDINGAFAMTIPRTGRYVVKAELAAFASATQEVRITAEATDQAAVFSMELASRAAAAEATAAKASAGQVASALGRGLQSLGVTGDSSVADATAGGGGTPTVQMPTLAGIGGDTGGGDSVAVSGQVGQTNGLGTMNEEEIRQRIEDAMSQARQGGAGSADMMSAVAGMLGGLMGGGGPGGPGGGGRGGRGGRGGGGGGGAFRGFNPTQPHGAIFWNGGNNALNAAPFSVSGLPVAEPGGYQNQFGVSFTGSPYIPGVIKADPRQFVFVNVTGGRNINPAIYNGTVPTLAERAGDFSATGIPLIDPATGLPFPNNMICPVATPNCSRLTSQTNAQRLLQYYPAPNVANVGTNGYNYQTITTAGANTTNASMRYVRNLGTQPTFGVGRRQQGNGPATLRQNINFNGSYNHSASDNRSIFLLLGGASVSTGYGINAGYTIGYGRFNNNASLNWNRSHSTSRNNFTNGLVNPAAFLSTSDSALAPITSNRFFYGVPNLSFTGFTGLNEATPSDSIGQTISFSDFVSYNHKRHNMRFGGDIRRVHSDSLGGSNPLGRLTFSGYATGSSFADFLLGMPQATSLQAGLNKIYLREHVFDWYAQDDWRLGGGLTLNYGVRYEYFGPYTEKNNHLVNLDHNADFSAVQPVFPGQAGAYSGRFNASLVNPDHAMYSPRFGFAYRVPTFKKFPSLTKEMVFRGGYGLNFNTGQYGSFARQLAFQPPFALTQTNSVPTTSGSGTAGCTKTNLTLDTPFGCSTVAVTNNFSVNKDYRLGHVQVFNLGMQKTLPFQTVLNIDYNGSVGGNLDMVRAPNRTATGLLDSSAQVFNYEDSLGFSRLNVLAVNLRKRQQKGISLQATYTYGHSIDNASSIGGSGTVVAQNDLDLAAEEGNSSFFTRHRLNGTWVIELPFGPNRAFLSKGGFWAAALDGFNVSGSYTLASGTYNTPHYSGTPQEVATGASGSLRPNRNFGVPVLGPGHLHRNAAPCVRQVRDPSNSGATLPVLNNADACWFNPDAFSAPAAGTYGTASRGDIEGPGSVLISSSLSRTVSFGSTRSFEGRVSASNVFNTVQYSGIDTTLNSPTFGQVSAAAARRSLSFTARYRF